MPRPAPKSRNRAATTPIVYEPGTDPLGDEQMAALVDLAASPYKDFVTASRELGVSEESIRRQLRRIEAQRGPVVGALRKVKTRELLDGIEDRISRTMEYLDDEMLAQTSAKDLAIILGILLEKRQLLRGEPTQILSMKERESLDALLPQLVAEATRRGVSMVVDGDFVDVTPATIPPQPRVAPHDVRKRQDQRSLFDSGQPLADTDTPDSPAGGNAPQEQPE